METHIAKTTFLVVVLRHTRHDDSTRRHRQATFSPQLCARSSNTTHTVYIIIIIIIIIIINK